MPGAADVIDRVRGSFALLGIFLFFALAAAAGYGAHITYSGYIKAEDLAIGRTWQAERLGGLPPTPQEAEAHWFGSGGPESRPIDVGGDRANQISAAGAMVTYFTGQAEASLEATIAIATAGLAASAIGLREVSKLVSLAERSSGRG